MKLSTYNQGSACKQSEEANLCRRMDKKNQAR